MMRPISRCLNKQLYQVCQQSLFLDELNTKIKPFLPLILQPHCWVGSFMKGCLTLMVDNAIWSTELRYILPELRDHLRKTGVYQLLSIKLEINTNLCTSLTRPFPLAKPSPSSPTSSPPCLQEVAQRCSYPPLKNALLELAHT